MLSHLLVTVITGDGQVPPDKPIKVFLRNWGFLPSWWNWEEMNSRLCFCSLHCPETSLAKSINNFLLLKLIVTFLFFSYLTSQQHSKQSSTLFTSWQLYLLWNFSLDFYDTTLSWFSHTSPVISCKVSWWLFSAALNVESSRFLSWAPFSFLSTLLP